MNGEKQTPAQSLGCLERRFSSRSTASRMNSAMRFFPTSASIVSRVSLVNRTIVGFVSDFLFSGGRPMRRCVSAIGNSVNFTSNRSNKRLRLLTTITGCAYNFNHKQIGDGANG